MNEHQVKTAVVLWANKVGRKTGIARLLLTQAMSVSTAERLVDGNYAGNPRGRVKKALLEVLAKDGFSLAGEEAS